MSAKNNYNTIAFCYDRLSKLVYGDSIRKSQNCLLSFISNGDKVLIVGGGTGWILEEICQLYPSGLNIMYVEASRNMMRLAQQRNTRENNVEFLKIYIEQYETASAFDVIFTPFLFDNFNEENAPKNFHRLNALLRKKGKWLFVDFDINKKSSYRNKWLLKTMYLFFKIATNIQAHALTDMKSLFLQNGYEEVFNQYHYNQFIKSSCWVRE